MSSESLSNLIRTFVIAMAVCIGITVCYILPTIGTNITILNPEFSDAYTPWMIIIWIATAPIIAVLVIGWKMSASIRNEQVFTMQTARLPKISSWLLLYGTLFFLIGNIVLLMLGMSHPIVLLLSVFAGVFIILLSVVLAGLSRYITKAAVLQEEADFTL